MALFRIVHTGIWKSCGGCGPYMDELIQVYNEDSLVLSLQYQGDHGREDEAPDPNLVQQPIDDAQWVMAQLLQALGHRVWTENDVKNLHIVRALQGEPRSFSTDADDTDEEEDDEPALPRPRRRPTH